MLFYGTFVLVSQPNPSHIVFLERIDVLSSCFTPVFINPIFELDDRKVPNFERKGIIDEDILLGLLLRVTTVLRQLQKQIEDREDREFTCNKE
jgi:hypothetical protein